MCNVCTFDRVKIFYCGDKFPSLWEDNLSCKITFLYVGVSSMSRYVDLSIVILISLYRRMDTCLDPYASV